MTNKKLSNALEEYKAVVLSNNYKYFVGIDASLKSTGVVLSQTNCLPIISKVINPPMDTAIARINTIVCELIKHLVNRESILAIIEKPFGVMGSGLILLELNGAIKNALYDRNISVVQVPQTTLKKFATGKGNAKKPLMLQASRDRYCFDVANDDIVDAFWLAKMGDCLVNGVDYDNQLQAIDKFWNKFYI